MKKKTSAAHSNRVQKSNKIKMRFTCTCHTVWGEQVFLVGSHPELGSWDIKKANAMTYFPGDEWKTEVMLSKEHSKLFEYKYIIRRDNGTVRWEASNNRVFVSGKEISVVLRNMHYIDMRDSWRDVSDTENIMLTSAFTDVLYKRHNQQRVSHIRQKGDERGGTPLPAIVVRLQVVAPRVDNDHSIYVVGSVPALGSWDPKKALPLHAEHYPLWVVDVVLGNEDIPFSYKYIIKDKKGKVLVYEEGSDNRVLSSIYFIHGLGEKESRQSLVSLHEDSKRYIVVTNNNFRHKKNWRGAGVAVPVFSLRTKNSFGVGEFLDIKLLVDWVSQSGMKLVQLLPVNDTSVNMNWWDSYPYSGLSVFALHPLYLRIQSIGTLSSAMSAEIKKHQKILNENDHVHYEEVISLKLRYAREIFIKEKNKCLQSAGFKKFYRENSYWLEPYAAFCYLRDLQGTSDYNTWGDHSRINEKQVTALNAPRFKEYDKVAFYYFVQYHLHVQFLEASQYAQRKRVVLKGDIPIGINKCSDSCWTNPSLFNLKQNAGAPPDPFSDIGQNWGFPTYNWYEMAYQNYIWWRWRFTLMSNYFQMIRLDHVLGFFRIWEIPHDAVTGIMGHFNPAIPLFREELEAKGIWDFNRLCQPYITTELLRQLFGEDTDRVKAEYLETEKNNCFRLKPEYNSQKKIVNHITASDDIPVDLKDKKEKLREGLFALVTNIILFKDQDKDGFHPRINMMNTYSYNCLDVWLKNILQELYMDYFYHRQEEFWREQAMIKLPIIKDASRMLIAGEDLGMIPNCVPSVMRELNILGLCIQRMPQESDRMFGYPHEYGYLTVCTTSSHDMSTIRAWWEENRKTTQKYYNEILGHHGEAPLYCESWISQDIIVRHLESPSMWAIFPIQDILAMSQELRYPGDPKAEQINNPANPHHYWKYRMHISLEKLIAKKNFSKELLSIHNNTGRNSNY
ncbi:MAG: 4-alpha-glucanotransferase [Candidatus Ancaeobacter aquaticus]|nr:4-alpha-glucanotransferase [Candidatus Ancaeobacter aquaticus]